MAAEEQHGCGSWCYIMPVKKSKKDFACPVQMWHMKHKGEVVISKWHEVSW